MSIQLSNVSDMFSEMKSAMPRLRMLVITLNEESSRAILTQIGSVNWVLLLSCYAVRFPLLRIWIDQICKESLQTCTEPSAECSDEDLILHLKALRLLVSRNYGIHHNQINLNIGLLVPLLKQSNEFVAFQVKSLLCECLHLPKEYHLLAGDIDPNLNLSNAILQDIWLGAAISGQQMSGSIAESVQRRLSATLLVLHGWVCDQNKLNRSLINLDGCILPVKLDSLEDVPLMVSTASTLSNLNALARAVLTEQPILVQGPAGCGKSTTIKELARMMGLHDELIVLHISEQTDSKALLGSYTCTDVPGEFVWIPGIITSAVMHGHWVVIEDVDKVPLDFIALFAPLLESRRLAVPALGLNLTAHTNFRIFSTRNTSNVEMVKLFSEETAESMTMRANVVPQLYHYSHLWLAVQITSMSAEELKHIVLQMYPRLPTGFLDKLLDCLFHVSNLGGDGHKGSHSVNLRDALKITKRIACYSAEYNNRSGYITDQLKGLALREIVDVMAARLRTAEQYLIAVQLIADQWGIVSTEIQSLVMINVPAIDFHPRADCSFTVSVGRARLPSDITNPMDCRHLQPFFNTSYVRRLLEKLAVCVQMNESVILVGETGNGKTTNVQELARLLGKKLVVQNLSLSSDISDLLGGHRPVTISQLFKPVCDQFVRMFGSTMSASAKNEEYMDLVKQCFSKQSWKKFLKLIEKASLLAMTSMEKAKKAEDGAISRRMQEWQEYHVSIQRYLSNLHKIQTGFAFSFIRGLLLEAYQQGHWILLDEINLASAETLQGLSGFLDPTQTSMIMDDGGMAHSSHTVLRHPDFRIFAAMNPPTDICKKELPPAIKSRFTELYVPELVDEADLRHIVSSFAAHAPVDNIVKVYLACRAMAEEELTDGSGQRPRYSLRSLTRSLRCALEFAELKTGSLERCLMEGFMLNFQMVLSEESQTKMFLHLKNGLYLSSKSQWNEKDWTFPSARPNKKDGWILVQPFWMRAGTLHPVDWAEKDERGIIKFVKTPTVTRNIRCISAAVASKAGSILLQGPTSIGKTSMIQYLAARLGKKCVRINNHEHTDVQEYIGGYVTGLDGQLSFRDGLLVEALRGGFWIILDELNLAPSDVLEALNRLLDDNQELLIAETGELVKPADGFQLFATQNPPGVYGGRKPLSLAFRNRFVEIDLSDLPTKEVEEIITQSCGIAPKFSTMMVRVMEELQLHRQSSALLLGKHGLVTTRDLIKWGRRQPQSNLDVARAGFMLLAEKLRTVEEKLMVESVLRNVCKSKEFSVDLYGYESTDSITLFDLQEQMRCHSIALDGVNGIAITDPLRRMWSLLTQATSFSEPVLMVGETGCGKTMVCQLHAAHKGQQLRVLNCHQSTETADLIGGLRPTRGRDGIKANVADAINSAVENGLLRVEIMQQSLTSYHFPVSADSLSLAAIMDVLIRALPLLRETGVDHAQSEIIDVEIVMQHVEEAEQQWGRIKALFEWVDGPLVEAMKNGDIFLIDEINLAEDAVIERLNSVLEFHRELTLAEKGGLDTDSLVAHPDFRIIATMNPSGDFGKRELSPALRSRFTEIWIPANNSYEDFTLIITEILGQRVESVKMALVSAMITFMKWFNAYMEFCTIQFVMTARELIAWAEFINMSGPLSVAECYSAMVHGAFLTLLDGLGIGHSIPRDQAKKIKKESLEYLLSLCTPAIAEQIRVSVEFLVFPSLAARSVHPHVHDVVYKVGDYAIPIGLHPLKEGSSAYATDAPSTVLNLGRVVRAMKIKRPILLEGPPGVGKTSIISHLARASGHHLVRINLSEHTELSDLLGSDLPCNNDSVNEGEDVSNAPRFKWFDGILLKAMKEGSWVLLDELNLAPQTVLEGLNACFDHREQVYLPDIGQTVHCAPSFRVFSAQNPMTEGGGRKGLPASFLSRFTRVYMESMTEEDMVDILVSAYGSLLSSLSLPDALTERFFSSMVAFIVKLNHDITVEMAYGRGGSPWEFNLRDMLRWCDLIKFSLEHEMQCSSWEVVMQAAYFLFVLRMRSPYDRDQVCRTFQRVFGVPLAVSIHPSVKHCGIEGLTVGMINLPIQIRPTTHLAQIHSNHIMRRHPGGFGNEKNLETLAWCVALELPVLLVGSYGSGKRSSIEQLARSSGNMLKYFSAIPSLDTSELLGAFEQSDKERSIRAVLQAIKLVLVQLTYSLCCIEADAVTDDLTGKVKEMHSVLHKYDADMNWDQKVLVDEVGELVLQLNIECQRHAEKLSTVNYALQIANEKWSHLLSSLQRFSGESFVWLNGVVVDSMEKGHWLLFDNVNLCSSSVLDRLNSLLESQGELVLNEDGSGRVVQRHTNFRIFFVMDPALGEVSRAMRNRCVEIYYDKQQASNSMLQAYLQALVLPDRTAVNACLSDCVALKQSYQPANLSHFDALHVQRAMHNLMMKAAVGSVCSERVAMNEANPTVFCIMAAAEHGLLTDLQMILLCLCYCPFTANSFQSVVNASLEQLTRSFGSTLRFICIKHGALIGPYVQAIKSPDYRIEQGMRTFLLMLLIVSEHSTRGCWSVISFILTESDRQQYQQLSAVVQGIVNLVCQRVSNVNIGDFLSIVCYHRSHMLLLEHHLPEGITSLYALSRAVSHKLVIPDSKEMLIIGYFWPILTSTEQLQHHAAAVVSSSAFPRPHHQEIRVDKVGLLVLNALHRRDVLVQQLQRAVWMNNSSNRSIPWELILIAVRWLQKAISKVVVSLNNVDAGIVAVINAADVEQAFSGLYSQFGALWKSSISLQKMSLWKLGGHNYVPRQAADWAVLRSLEDIVLVFTADLPVFIDQGDGACVKTASVYRTGAEMKALDDWLGIYATFYWQCTNEVRAHLKSAFNKSKSIENSTAFVRMMEPLKEVLDARRASVDFERDTMTVDGEDCKQDALLDSKTLAAIRTELKDRQILGLRWYADYIVLNSFGMLRMVLAAAVCCRRTLLEHIPVLAVVLRHVLAMGLCYATFCPLVLRQCKTLLWFAEYVESIEEMKLEILPWEDISSLMRSLLVGINAQSFKLTACNMTNHIQAIDMSFGSTTLAECVGDDKKIVQRIMQVPSGDMDTLSATGWSRQLQATSSAFALRHFDAQLLFPVEVSLQVQIPRTDAAMSVSIAAYQRAKSSLSLTLQACLTKNGIAHANKKLSDVNKFVHIGLNMLDVLVFNKQLFQPTVHAAIDQLQYDMPVGHTAAHLLSFDLPAYAVDAPSSQLLTKCLQPVLNLLVEHGRDDSSAFGEFHQMIVESYCSVSLGVLKAHVLLSNSPIDPAMKPHHKHQLLSPIAQQMAEHIHTALTTRSFADGSLVDENVVADMLLIDQYDKRDQKYIFHSIQRPDDAPRYAEVYTTLLNILQGPLSASTTMTFADKLLHFIRHGQTSQASLHVLQQEELTIQSILFTSYDSLQRSFGSFDDIISVFRACIQDISRGVRLLIGVAGYYHSQSSQVQRKLLPDGMATIWSQIIGIHNISASRTVDSKLYRHSQKANLNALIRRSNVFSQCLTAQLQQNCSASSRYSNALDSNQLTAFQNNLQNLLHLLALSKIKLLTGCAFLNITDVNGPFNEIMQRFVHQYLNRRNTQREKRAEEASLYIHKKAKPSTPIIAANGAGDADDEQEFRENFPDHLEKFNALIDSESYSDPGVVDEVAEDGFVDNDKLVEDGSVLLQIISTHAKLVLLQSSTQMHYDAHRVQSSGQYIVMLKLHSENHFKYGLLMSKVYGNFSNSLSQRLVQFMQHHEPYTYAYLNNCIPLQSSGQAAHKESKVNGMSCDRDLLLLLDAEGSYRGVQQEDSLFSQGCHNPASFHFDSNIQEVVLANAPLNQVLSRAITLLQTLPNNDVLMRIIKLTYTISLMHITIPLGKMINSIQMLLKHIHQYEEFAHKLISFSNEIAVLSSLLKRYRSLELQSWQHLLRNKEVVYSKQAMNYWFSLMKVFKFDVKDLYKKYNSLGGGTNVNTAWARLSTQAPAWLYLNHTPTADAVGSSDMDSYLADKMKLLDSFLSESPVGEFAMRLHLLRLLALAVYTDNIQFAHTIHNSQTFMYRLESMLFGIWHFYSQYLPVVRSFQDLLQEPLQRQVKDEIKLNKWDNITIVAMLENSEKINRKLNKFLKQYTTDVLDFPVRRLLYRENMKEIVNDVGEMIAATDVPTNAVLFPHAPQTSTTLPAAIKAFSDHYSWTHPQKNSAVELVATNAVENYACIVKLPKLLIKMKKYLHTVFQPAEFATLQDDPYACGNICTGLNSSVIFEELCGNIFSRIQSLRGEKVNRQLKQRALRDMLNTLREQGFSHLRSEVPVAQICNNVDIFTASSVLPRMFAQCLLSNNNADVLQKAEMYVLKCMTELAQLRAQTRGVHNEDISHAESAHMLIFSESMLTHALRMRTGIEAGLQSLQQYHQALQALSVHCVHVKNNSAAIAPAHILYSVFANNIQALRVALHTLVGVQTVIQAASKVDAQDLSADVNLDAIAVIPQQKYRDAAMVMDVVCNTLVEAVASFDNSKSTEQPVLVTAPQLVYGETTSVYISMDMVSMQLSMVSNLFDQLQPILVAMSPVLGADQLQSSLDIFQQVLDQSNAALAAPVAENDEKSDAKLFKNINKLVEKCLITVQHMTTLHDVLHCKASPSTIHGCFNEVLLEKGQELQLKDMSVTQMLSWTLASLAHCSVDEIAALMVKVNSNLQSHNVDPALAPVLQNTHEMASLLQRAYLSLVDQSIIAYKAQVKFSYVCLRVFRHLLAKGYCGSTAKDMDEEGDGQGAPTEWEDDVEGTGMGEGEGKKDVSDQITNEEQLLDLKQSLEKSMDAADQPQQQKQQQEKLSKEEQEQGVEMDQDFSGDMHDMDEVPQDEDQDEDDKSEDMDRQMDDRDEPMNMDNIVSEKAWDDEDEEDEKPQDRDEHEKFEEGAAMQGEALEDEMRTNNDKQQQDKDKDKGAGNKQDKPLAAKDQEEDEDEGASEEVHEDREEDYMDRPQGAERMHQDQDQDQADDEEEGEGDEEQQEQGMDGPDDHQQHADDADEDDAGHDDEAKAEVEGGADDDGDQQQQLPDSMQIDDEGGAPEEEGQDQDQPEPQAEGEAEGEEEVHGADAMDTSAPEEAHEEDNKEVQGSAPPTTEGVSPPAYGVQAADGKESILGTSEEVHEQSAAQDLPAHGNSSAEQKQGGARQSSAGQDEGERGGASGGPQGDEEVDEGVQEPKGRRPQPNPFLPQPQGDITKEWFRRLHLLGGDDQDEEEEVQDEEVQQGARGGGEGVFEYADGDRDEDMQQVLGEVSAEQAAPLQGAERTPEEVEQTQDSGKRTTPEEVEQQPRKRPRLDHTSSEVQSPAQSASATEEVQESMETDEEVQGGADEEEKEVCEEVQPLAAPAPPLPRSEVVHTERSFAFGTSSAHPAGGDDEEVIEVVQQQQQGSQMPQSASALWQLHVSQTEAPALRLAEQLRLILEPTLASRLQGDYRTGKRINMRRVIPYIASGYRKDKIWLRRTKMAKRAYQVMLLVDDSRSMGRAGPLAVQSLALLSTALTRLEIGELAVLSFAEQVKVLHGFGDVFTAASGARVAGQLTFQAESTKLNASLRAVLPVFQAAAASAASSSTSGAVLQICFVLSDARIESDDRERLTAVLRSMAEQHILVVLVIIDIPADPRDSIFNTRTVRFTAEGAPQVSSYLEGFPFPYYVVVQDLDLQRMPELLADALKQWFELIKMQMAAASA